MKKTISGLSLTAMTAVILAGCSAAEAPSEQVKTAAAKAIEATSDTAGETVKDAATKSAQVSETRSADSHTHGAAALALVLENGVVTAEFETPLYNLLGFEHAAETEAQKAAVKKAETVLSNPAPLFVFNSSAKCAPAAERISVELGLDDHGQDHRDHEHDDSHKHDEDHSHDDDHGHADDEHSDHKDVILSYEFSCQNPDALTEVTVNLFEHFDNLAELDLVYLGPNTQKQISLNAANSRASLTR